MYMRPMLWGFWNDNEVTRFLCWKNTDGNSKQTVEIHENYSVEIDEIVRFRIDLDHSIMQYRDIKTCN